MAKTDHEQAARNLPDSEGKMTRSYSRHKLRVEQKLLKPISED